MKRIGRWLSVGLTLAVASGLALAHLVVSGPAAAADPLRDIAQIEWEADGGTFGKNFSAVRLNADRIEAAHEGMPVPKLRYSTGQPIQGQPYYFFGKDPDTGKYLPSSILLCIDMLHIDYEVPDGSEYFDLATLVPAETSVRISRTINAGLQLAGRNGLYISTDGSKPLSFLGDKGQDIMVAAQIMAWHLFARDNVSAPLPFLERSDFSVDKTVPVAGGGATETIVDYDVTSWFAQIDELVERYALAPAFDTSPVRFADGSVTLTDPEALSGFAIDVDATASTPGWDAYLTVTTKSDGTIQLTRKRTIDRPLTLGFVKKFKHGLGADGLASGVRAANHQFKTVLSNVYTETFAVPVAPSDGAVIVRKSDPGGTALDGAEFTLFDSTGTTVARDSWGRPLVGLSGADGDGRLMFRDVPPGRYVLVETRAPDGYTGDRTPREVVVTSGGQMGVNGGRAIVNTRETSDLAIVKSNGRSVLKPGQLTTYEIAVADPSASSGAGAVVEDVLPEGLRFDSADHGGVYDAATRTVRWEVGPVGATPIVVSVTARVEDSVAPGTTIANRATVTVDGVCPGSDDLSACEDVDADSVPALELVKSDGTDVAAPGETGTYELTVVNTSDVDAPDVVITDALPDGLAFVAADANGRYAEDDREVTWKLGTLAAGERRTVHVSVWVDDELAPGAEVVNTASASSEGLCPDGAGCRVEDVDRVPAVSVTKDDGTETVVAGQRLEYRIVATNTSDVAATDVIVSDRLPHHAEFVAASLPPADGSAGPVLRWELGALAPGESREIVVTLTVQDHVLPGTIIVNTASVTAAGVCVDDAKTDLDECTAVDEDVVVTPPVPVEPEEPGTPTDPGTPVDPTEPGAPVDPDEPGAPVDPTEPGAPVDPDEPGAPGEPVDPDEPGTPTAPTEGIEPAESGAAGPVELAQTGQNTGGVLGLGALAAVLLITAGASAIAVRRRHDRRAGERPRGTCAR